MPKRKSYTKRSTKKRSTSSKGKLDSALYASLRKQPVEGKTKYSSEYNLERLYKPHASQFDKEMQHLRTQAKLGMGIKAASEILFKIKDLAKYGKENEKLRLLLKALTDGNKDVNETLEWLKENLPIVYEPCKWVVETWRGSWVAKLVTSLGALTALFMTRGELPGFLVKYFGKYAGYFGSAVYTTIVGALVAAGIIDASVGVTLKNSVSKGVNTQVMQRTIEQLYQDGQINQDETYNFLRGVGAFSAYNMESTVANVGSKEGEGAVVADPSARGGLRYRTPVENWSLVPERVGNWFSSWSNRGEEFGGGAFAYNEYDYEDAKEEKKVDLPGGNLPGTPHQIPAGGAVMPRGNVPALGGNQGVQRRIDFDVAAGPPDAPIRRLLAPTAHVDPPHHLNRHQQHQIGWQHDYWKSLNDNEAFHDHEYNHPIDYISPTADISDPVGTPASIVGPSSSAPPSGTHDHVLIGGQYTPGHDHTP